MPCESNRHSLCWHTVNGNRADKELKSHAVSVKQPRIWQVDWFKSRTISVCGAWRWHRHVGQRPAKTENGLLWIRFSFFVLIQTVTVSISYLNSNQPPAEPQTYETNGDNERTLPCFQSFPEVTCSIVAENTHVAQRVFAQRSLLWKKVCTTGPGPWIHIY